MSEGPIDLVKQVRAHLDSLAAAGLLFVPRGAPLALAPRAAPAAPAPTAPQAPVEDPRETRVRALAVLRAEVEACDKCSELFGTRTQTVFGTGPLDPEVLFVGDAPGAAEDAQGEPFVGSGGQLLRRIIAACQLPSAQEYLMNITKCRTPKNRAPTRTECLNCRDFFVRQFELVRPKYVVALGRVAANLLTRTTDPLSELRGQVHDYRGVPLICTHHPNDIENSEPRKREAWEDMKLLLRTMGREVPGGK